MRKEVLVFDIKGYAAHFRKFYTNSSSLSYSIPPRTTISGLIAAILGLERDSYYNNFFAEKVDIGVRKNNKTRKILQSVNYMKITTSSEFEFPKNHTQIPFEMVFAEEGLVSYRIYLSCIDNEMIKELEERLKKKKYYYTPSLGTAPFNCSIEYIDRILGEVKNDKKNVSISSVIPISKIENRGIQLSDLDDEKVMLVKERMAREFRDHREIKSVESYIYDENTNPLPVRLKDGYIQLSYGEIRENILFM